MPRLRYIEETRKDAADRRHDRIGQEDRRARSARGLDHDAQQSRHRLGRIVEQGALQRRAAAQAQGNVPHPDFGRAPVRLLLDRALQRRQGRRPDRGDDQRSVHAYETSPHFTPREKAALRYANLFKQGEHAIDKDEVYRDLQKHFSDEEIIELGMLCAQTDGVGKFVKSLNVMSWEEACEINPKLARRGAGAASGGITVTRRAGTPWC